MKHHITEDGPRPCKASIKDCPIGGEHYPTAEEAQRVYENAMKDKEIPTVMGKDSKIPHFRSISIPLTKNTEKIVNLLHEAGVRGLLVGGTVRDRFLGINSKDVDLELYGANQHGGTLNFEDITPLFSRKEGYKVDEAGASFSVLKVRKGGEDFDLALPRTEKSTGDHHTDYDVHHDSTMSFEEASTRRDFTINSIGYDPRTGEVLDPNNGVADIESKTLRHVSEAFSDDPLRCMRAVNFASRFGFTLHPETEKLCRDLAPTYNTLAHERVEEEFNKLFSKGEHCETGLTVFHDIEWSKQVPEFSKVSREQFQEYGEKLNKAPKGVLRKAALTHLMQEDGHPDSTAFLESSSSGRTLIHKADALLKGLGEGSRGSVVENHRAIKARNPEIKNKDLTSVAEAVGKDSSLLRTLPETPKETVVTGKRLLELGYKPGPEMGKMIKKAQAIQDAEDLEDFDLLLNRAMKSE